MERRREFALLCRTVTITTTTIVRRESDVDDRGETIYHWQRVPNRRAINLRGATG
jgi:hypothetical protein